MAGDDERPRPGKRYPTPASGVRAITERSVREQAEAARRFAEDLVEVDEETPINMPIPMQLARQRERAKAVSATTTDIQIRVGKLEEGLSDARVEIGYVAQQVSSLDGNVELLVEEAKESRRERQTREAAADRRAELEIAYRRDRMLKILTIVTPTLVALGGIIAGIAGAFK